MNRIKIHTKVISVTSNIKTRENIKIIRRKDIIVNLRTDKLSLYEGHNTLTK